MHELVEKYGQKYDSFYVYHQKAIVENIETLQKYFTQTQILYSVKCNSHPEVLKCIFSQGVGADAASVGEVQLALDNGVPKDKIMYSAPGKTPRMLEQAMGKCVIIADSLAEVLRINSLAAKRGLVEEIGIRINPDFTINGEGGVANKFGIDQDKIEELLAMDLPHIRIVGIHVHVKSQQLNSEILRQMFLRIIFLAHNSFIAKGYTLKFVNLGSGIGIPYVEDMEPIDLDWVGGYISGFLKSPFHQTVAESPDSNFYLESGRFITGTAGEYFTKVVDKKESHGKTILILAHTLSGFLRITTSKIWTQYGLPEAEPLYCAPLIKSIRCHGSSEETEVVSIYGSLCTGMDCIAEDIELPKLEIGDFVSFPNAGAYGAAITPMQFSSLEKPAEIFIED